MWFFNKKKKERMKAEKEKAEKDRENNSSYYEYSSNRKDMSIDDLFKEMYGETFDDYFKDMFYNAKTGYHSYRKSTYENVQPKIDNTIDNAFKLLSLNKDDDEKTIKKRYRELSMKWHPDKYQNDTLENQGIATRNFTKLNNAYEAIKKYKQIK